jgi:excisionase family DNA binding protein
MTVFSLSQAKIHLGSLSRKEIAMDALLSVEEAARKLGGLSKYTIHAWLSSGKLRRTKVGSRTMIRESELLKVVEDGGKSQSANRSRKGLPHDN